MISARQQGLKRAKAQHIVSAFGSNLQNFLLCQIQVAVTRDFGDSRLNFFPRLGDFHRCQVFKIKRFTHVAPDTLARGFQARVEFRG